MKLTRSLVAPILVLGMTASCDTAPVGQRELQTIPDFGSGVAVQIVWPEGRPDDQLSSADAEAVDALREWDVLVSVARITHDYSDARMLELSSDAIYATFVSDLLEDDVRQVRQGTQWQISYPMGPTPFVVRSVRHESGQVQVEVCRGSAWWNRSAPDGAEWRDATGVLETYWLERSEDTYAVHEHRSSLQTCSIEGARFGFFESPTPPYGEGFEFGDIILSNGDPVTAEMAAAMP